MTPNITGNDFHKVINSDKTVLLDFYADWCGPCKLQAPILDSLAGELDGVQVYKVNVDEEQELAQKYEILGIPTLLVMKGGEVVGRKSGLQAKNAIKEMLAV